MEKPDQCPEHVYQTIMLNCWVNEPKSRPKFDELVRSFEYIIDHQPEYVNLRYLLLHTSSNDPSNSNNNNKKSCTGVDATTSSSSVFLEPSSASSSRSSTNSTSTSTTRAYSSSINSYSSKESLREAFKHENLLLIDEEKDTTGGGLSNWKKSVGGASSKKIRKGAINNKNLIYLRSDETDDHDSLSPDNRDVFEVAEEDSSQVPTIKNDKKTVHAVKIPKFIVNILK